MTLHYVCTDFDLDGPSVQERARIGILLSSLYFHYLADRYHASHSEGHIADAHRSEAKAVWAEMEAIASLLGLTAGEWVTLTEKEMSDVR